MEMTRQQATRNMAVGLLLVIAGIILLIVQSFLLHPVVAYVLGGIIVVAGLAMLGEKNKMPGIITLLVGVAVLLLRGFAQDIVRFVGWIIILAGIALALISFFAIKKSVGK
mgnify:CR=1 FL=1